MIPTLLLIVACEKNIKIPGSASGNKVGLMITFIIGWINRRGPPFTNMD